MKVDYCFVLAAGFGTRMGIIGKELPKVLWPVFEKPLLELQVDFAKSLGLEDISFNLHYQADQILKLRESNQKLKEASALSEDIVLDIGGGIHNFAKEKNYQGNVLILNADQFLMFDKAFLDKIQDEGQVATLFTKTVTKREGYNKLLLENSNLIDIVQNKDIEEEKFQTYSGCSLINLSLLKPTEGPSSFFKTIANFQNNKVVCLNTDAFEYNDFGTRDRYFESIQDVLHDRRPFFKNFLLKTESFKNQSGESGHYVGNIRVDQNSISLDGKAIDSNMRFQYKGIQDN